MCLTENQPAQLCVQLHPLRAQGLDDDRALSVAELPHVEVASLTVLVDPGRPAEEEVARRLEQALSLDHPLPLVVEARCRHMVGEHRPLRFFDLQEQRITQLLAGEQDDPRPRADAADADHLERDVDDRELVEERLHVQGHGVR